jgi:type III secretory pathway component EscU
MMMMELKIKREKKEKEGRGKGREIRQEKRGSISSNRIKHSSVTTAPVAISSAG